MAGSKLTAVAIPLLFSLGCSTLASRESGGVYRESATDIVNRAPQSMSVQTADSVATDEFHARTQADYHFALAESLSLSGQVARAIEEYKLTLVFDPASSRVRVRLASEYLKQGLISESMEEAKRALELDPNYVDGRLLLGGIYSALRMYDDSLREYRAALSSDPENLEAPLFIGALLAEQKNFAEAAVQFESLAKNANNPIAHVAWYYLGRVRLEEDVTTGPAKAEAAFLKSLEAKPNYTEAALALGGLYEASGREQKATNMYLAFQEKQGPNAAVAEELARIFIAQKDYARAYSQLEVIESSDPQDLNVKAKMAFILIEQRKYPEAISRLEDILAQEPVSDKIRFYLGAVYEEVKDYQSAVDHFEKIPLGSGYYEEAIVHASYLYKLIGNYEKAFEVIQSGIKNKSDHAPFYALYASLLDDQKQYKRAAEMLADAVLRFPDHPQLVFYLGNMQDRLGDKDATVTSMRRVLEIDKDHVQALNFLAYTYAESGKNLDEAERLVRRALELKPEDGYILDTLGWVLFKKGQVDDAIRTLEAAYKIEPNEAVIAEHLGDAYYHRQMPEKAKALYRRAMEIETNVAVIEKIRSKIVSIEKQIQRLGADEGVERLPASATSR